MIRLSSALKISWTKFKSKPGMIIGSILVSSLLFGVLFGSIIVFTGAESSISRYIQKAGNDKYLIQVSPHTPFDAISFANPLSLEDVRTVKSFEKAYYDQLKNRHKELKIEYDTQAEIPALTPASWLPTTLPEEQRVILNYASPVIDVLNHSKQEAYLSTATNKFNDLKRVADNYGANGYYKVDKSTGFPTIPTGRLIVNGKEDFSVSELKSGDMTPYGYYTHAIQNGSYSYTDQNLLARYLTTTDTSKLKGIPVIVSTQEAVSLFGNEQNIDSEPTSEEQKKEWIQNIQQKLTGHTYSVCYRNQTEQTMLEKIQKDYTDLKSTPKQDYVKPKVTHAYPTEECGPIRTEQDSRTTIEKQASLKLIADQKKLGTYSEPHHELVTFQIVGFKHAQPFTDYSKGAQEYIQSLLSPQSTTSAIDIPIQMYDSLPDELKFDASKITNENSLAAANEDFVPRVLEFKAIEEARLFLDNETCALSSTECKKQFLAAPYGSNFLIVDEITKLFFKIASIIFPLATALAAVIIWFTVSRVIIDSRKETAVFRAMGALRLQIAQIYITYVLLMAFFILLTSAAIGLSLGLIVNQLYGPGLASTASSAFGIIDNAPLFTLFSATSPLLLGLSLLIILVSILASIQPLLRNVRRNPIEDLRQ